MDDIKLFAKNEKAETKEKNDERVFQTNESKLNCRNLFTGINIWAFLLIRYSGSFLNWTREELQQIYQRTRKLMLVAQSLPSTR